VRRLGHGMVVVALTLGLFSFGIGAAAAASVNSCPWRFDSNTGLSSNVPDVVTSWSFVWSCAFDAPSLSASSYMMNAAFRTVGTGSSGSCSGVGCKSVSTSGSGAVPLGTTNVVHVTVRAVLKAGQMWAGGDALSTAFCTGWQTATLQCHFQFPALAAPGALTILGSPTGGGI
jgi:hypothetical protein